MSEPVPLSGSVRVRATRMSPATEARTNRSRWAGVACGFIDRQVPLITCTSIRMEACEREKISIRYIHWVKLSPRPPRETGAARPRKPSSRSSAKSSGGASPVASRSEEHTSELQSRFDLVCRLLLEKKNIGHREYRSL